ncbi:hypothetical protein V6N11_004994 [Hibiscus sabdariffa]|uniref:RNase H type-1 domain-containing protein n=1 Tax=Hibiscus sabdariffa TaxID=183260 RepID=A0ABR2NHZ8_9ROSI
MQRESVFAFPPAAGRSIRDSENVPPVIAARWLKPPRGWCKPNDVGAVARGSGMTACGGVVRDEEGNWLIGFSRKLGVCLILEAELWGLYEGLLAAWSINIRYLIIESDNLEAVKLLNNRNGLSIFPSIVHYIVEIMKRPWTTKLFHIG